MHGARGGAARGSANPAYLHGHRSQDAVLTRKATMTIVRQSREVIELLQQLVRKINKP